MRRYLPLFALVCTVLLLVLAGTFLAGYTGQTNPQTGSRSIVVYTTLPVEPMAILAQEYEKQSGVRVTIVPLAPAELLTRAKFETTAVKADVFIASADTLEEARRIKLLAPYSSEQTDIIPSRFSDPDDHWTGLWYDPIIFAANKDYLNKLASQPAKWADLPAVAGRLAITDFLAADASANLLFTMAAASGEDAALAYLAKLHPKVVQYSKFLATPVRMVGLGEADVAIAVQSETLRYVQDGFPVRVITPAEGTAVFLTAAGVAAGAPHAAEAGKFIDWLIQDEAQQVLFANRYYFVPANPAAKICANYDVKNLKLLEYEKGLTDQQKTKLLDRWVQKVRLSPR